MVSGRGVLAAAVVGAWVFSGAAGDLEAQTTGGKPALACNADVAKALAGVWRAPQYKMKRASEVGAQVFGANSFDIRDVELTLEPSGEGVVKISTSVQDAKGRTHVPAAIEARVAVKPGQTNTSGKCEPVVTVTSAEEQYLDATKYRAPLEGARIALLVDPAVNNQFDLRFEPPNGTGAFWTTVRRQAGRK